MFDKMRIEELVEYIREDKDSEAFENLFKRFENLIYKFYGMYAIHCYDLDDFMQEGRMVLLTTIHQFNPTLQAYFAPYYKVNLRNHLINLCKRECAEKRGGGQRELYFLDLSVGEETIDYLSNIPDPSIHSCDDSLVYRECSDYYFSGLSRFERNVLQYHLSGYSRKEISSIMSLTQLQIRNAMDRSRKKIRKKQSLLEKDS